MKKEISEVLALLDIQPILVDVGASDAPPAVWKPIAPHAIYVGFDPDRRQTHDVPEGQYGRSIIVNKAIVDREGQSEAHFFLTHSPYCSSTLRPDTESLANYLFSDLFVVENETSVSASTLNAVFEQMDIQRVDWFKTDSQGTDLRLFQSLPDHLRRRVLAVDIEPGLIDVYQNEDLFVDAHRELTRQGLWLSSMDVKGSVRISQRTRQAMRSYRPNLTDADVHAAVRPSPGWVEARYLQTLESLVDHDAEERDYALLWVFAIIERQWGYALEIAFGYEQRFTHDTMSNLLRDLPLRRITKGRRNPRSLARRYLPMRFRQLLKKLCQV